MNVMKSSHVTPAFETRPLYLQVHGQLMGFIVKGQWQPGAMIPNEVELARDFGVSVGTMRKALQTLTEQGLLTRRQGRGSFVAAAEAMDATPLDNLRTNANEPLQWTVISKDLSAGQSTQIEASALDVDPGTRVVRLRRLMRDATAATEVLEYSTLPEERFAGLAADGDGQDLPIAILARRYGLLIGPSAERLQLIFADQEKAKYLDIKSGMPLLKLERIAKTLEGVPVEFRIAFCKLGPDVTYSNQMR